MRIYDFKAKEKYFLQILWPKSFARYKILKNTLCF